MVYDLTDDQPAFGCAIREWLTDRFDLAAVRAFAEDPHAHARTTEVWKAASDQGWLAVTVPEKYDGVGLGLLEAAAVAEALGSGLAPAPVLHTMLACEAILLGGDAGQQSRWLPRLAVGELLAVPALRSTGGAWNIDGIGVHVDAVGRLCGDAGTVEFAASADLLVVAARDTDGAGLWLVQPRAEGVTLHPTAPLDRTVQAAHVLLDSAPAQRLTASTPATIAALFTRGALLSAAEVVGAAERVLALTVQYLCTRTQFGVPIGSFQAVQHELAELYVGLTLAKDGVRYAAHALDGGASDAELMTSIAKAKTSDVCPRLAAAAVHFHGAVGFAAEHDAHLFFRRIHRGAAAYGDTTWHRRKIASAAVEGHALADNVQELP
jgi:alkylation response protein AidB-like acyl-CoA dehydrogenase